LKPERWERIKQIFDEALEKDADIRAEFLRKACEGDESLRSEVESMLARNSESQEFLGSPALEGEAQALAEELKTRMIGSTFGHYRIASQLGRGGMGEVYLADDVSLNRKVALKFLPDIFSGDPERMARFEREAKLLASFNHPNIAAIHGLEQAKGKRFLVLELVEGETLAHRLRKGMLPMEEALGICRQIAEALESAHEKGIIHRDLKPANVMITAGDRVKLLDFGLAKALSSETQNTDLSKSPTVTEAMTRPGVVLGTAAYMSPEQAKGKTVDKRADIWALGCILYECLTGQRAFEGETVTETLAAILKGEPNWQALPAAIPANIRFVLRRCLEKDVRRRFHDAADVQIQMEEADDIGETKEIAAAPQRLSLGWCAAAVLFVALATIAFIHFCEKPPASAKPAQLQIAFPDAVKHVDDSGFFALSPDGTRLAFEAAGSDGITRVWIRTLDSLEARPLPGTETSQWCIIWSPDGTSIAFSAGGKLKKINISGGPPQEICSLTGPVHGGAWNRDGVIILGQSGGTGELMRVPSEGGALSRITELNRERKELMHLHPTFLPDGKHFLYFCLSAAPNTQGIYLGDLDSSTNDREGKLILTSNHQPVYVPSQDSGNGTLLFQRQDALMAQAFDEKQMELFGEPLPVAEKVGFIGNYGLFSASHNGVLVYKTITNPNTQPTWFDRQGKILGTVGEPGFYFRVALSPTGERAAVARRTPPGMLADVWLLDFFRGTTTRLTFAKGDSMRPVWSPDGNRVAYSGTREGGAPGSLYQKPASGAEKEQLLFKSSESKFVTSWSSDGRYLLYTASNPKTKNDLWMLSLEGGPQANPLLNSEFNEDDGQFSPGMHWIAYVSDESGRDEVYVQEFSKVSGNAPKGATGEWQQITQGGGKGPRWRGDEKELFYQAPDGTVMAVGIAADKRFRTGVPKVLFKAPPSDAITRVSSSASPVWDVTRDGNRFLLAIPALEGSSTPFTVILNWTALLKK
jgi:serine/threonine protein kinase/Tol biopolymer transport system component